MIPNLLTLGNLACGLVAIVLLMEGNNFPHQAATIGWLMMGAMLLDFFDGFVARALKATSPIGKELDSLSDVVSFGVLPGLMVYTILKIEIGAGAKLSPVEGWHTTITPWYDVAFPFIGLVIPLLSALRLAKFNVDTRQSYGFLGLPTPANALFFLSIFLIFWLDGNGLPTTMYNHLGDFEFANSIASIGYPILRWLHNPWVLASLAVFFSILLVTEIPLLAMKFKDYTLKNNWPRYLLIVLSITLLAVLWFRAIPLIIVLYFLLSFIDTLTHKKA
jgi:CDP-diacylglycerol---serine O-phosphatidyltransferase